jgi:hypothetical protein
VERQAPRFFLASVTGKVATAIGKRLLKKPPLIKLAILSGWQFSWFVKQGGLRHLGPGSVSSLIYMILAAPKGRQEFYHVASL